MYFENLRALRFNLYNTRAVGTAQAIATITRPLYGFK